MRNEPWIESGSLSRIVATYCWIQHFKGVMRGVEVIGDIRELTEDLPGKYREDTGKTMVPLTENTPIRMGDL